MKKLITISAVMLLAGALLTGCGNGKDGDVTSSDTLSVPSPSEVISNTESAVENLVSDVISGVESAASALNPSSATSSSLK